MAYYGAAICNASRMSHALHLQCGPALAHRASLPMCAICIAYLYYGMHALNYVHVHKREDERVLVLCGTWWEFVCSLAVLVN